jgi:hypothetical protein
VAGGQPGPESWNRYSHLLYPSAIMPDMVLPIPRGEKMPRHWTIDGDGVWSIRGAGA